jgi:hypothetical protein
MEYSKIIAITGLPGLFELISSKSDGGIVRSLEDKSTRFVSSRVHQFSHLESIEVYTIKHNVNLVDVLKAMETSKEKLPDDKDAGALKKYFETVFPELDQERVYTSDLKKMVKWFAVLSKNEVEIKLTEQPVEDAEPVVLEKEEKPVKKSSIKTDVKSETKTTEVKKPAKKAPAEKVAEVTPAKKTAAKKETPAKKAPAKKEEPTAKKSTAKPAEKKAAAKKK